MGYPETVSNDTAGQEIAQKYKTFFESLEFVLPCEWCKMHYKDNLALLPITPYLDGRRNLAMWVYKFHNLVNDETSVPESERPTFEEVYKMYDRYRVPCDEDSKTCGGSEADKCRIVVQDSSEKFGTDHNVFSSYWPLMLIVTGSLVTIGIISLNKGKKRKK